MSASTVCCDVSLHLFSATVGCDCSQLTLRCKATASDGEVPLIISSQICGAQQPPVSVPNKRIESQTTSPAGENTRRKQTDAAIYALTQDHYTDTAEIKYQTSSWQQLSLLQNNMKDKEKYAFDKEENSRETTNTENNEAWFALTLNASSICVASIAAPMRSGSTVRYFTTGQRIACAYADTTSWCSVSASRDFFLSVRTGHGPAHAAARR